MRKTIYRLIYCSIFICPFSLHAQWIKTNGLIGGSTSTLMTYGDTVLAKIGSELYYSVNHGKAWSPIENPDLENTSVYSSDEETIIGRTYNLDPSASYFYRTSDFFQTLHPIFLDTLKLNWLFPAHGYIYAQRYQSPNSGLYRTNNDGANWELVTTTSLGLIQYDGQRLTGVKSKFIIQSTDEGFTWDTLLQYAGYANRLIQHENHFFLLTFGSSTTAAGCYVSNDYGQSWQYYPNDVLDNIYDFIWHNGSLFGLDGDRVITSADFGQTWQHVPLPQGSAYPAYFGASSGNALLIGGAHSMSSNGMYRSTDDGATWNPVLFGIKASSGKLKKYNHDLFVPSPGGLFKAKADGLNWINIDLNIPQPPSLFWTVSDFAKSGDKWIVSDGENVWTSNAQGNIWSKSYVQPGQSNLPASIEVLENIQNKVIAHGPWQGYDDYYFYISDDNGLTFKFIESLYGQFQTKIKALEVWGDKVYALGSDHKIYRSDNACLSWVLQSDNLPFSGCASPNPIDIGGSFRVSGNAMILVNYNDSKINFSNDGGQNWTCYDLETSGSPWGNSIPTDLLYFGNTLLAASNNGIYVSENDGMTWEAWNEGLTQNDVNYIETHNGYLWASAAGGGIWKRPLNQLLTGPVPSRGLGEENLTEHLDLISQLQFVPNPASEKVRIKTQGQSGEVVVQDATGRVFLHQSVGNAVTEISVQSLPPGIYQLVFLGEQTMLHGTLLVQH